MRSRGSRSLSRYCHIKKCCASKRPTPRAWRQKYAPRRLYLLLRTTVPRTRTVTEEVSIVLAPKHNGRTSPRERKIITTWPCSTVKNGPAVSGSGAGTRCPNSNINISKYCPVLNAARFANFAMRCRATKLQFCGKLRPKTATR